MQHVHALQNHPHRDWILAGIGAATLICAYACYKCCCGKEKTKKVIAVEEPARKSVFADYIKEHEEEKEAVTTHAETKSDRTSTAPARGICDDYMGKVGECKCPGTRATAGEGEESHDKKPANDGNKYLPKVIHSPPYMVCPPARVGISLFMDSRPNCMNPMVLSNANTYQRDRFYRGSYNKLSPPSGAYIRASQLHTSVQRGFRSGKRMQMKISDGFK